MPTLAELANEVNEVLSQIETHTKDAAETVALAFDRGDTIDATLDAGLAFLGQGIFALLEAQRVTNARLATVVEQLDVTLSRLMTVADMMGERLRTLDPPPTTPSEAVTDEPRAQGWDGQWKRRR